MKTLSQRVKTRIRFSNRRLNHSLYRQMMYPRRFRSMSNRIMTRSLIPLKLKSWCRLKKFQMFLRSCRKTYQRCQIQLSNLCKQGKLFKIANKSKTRKSVILKVNLRLMSKSKYLSKFLFKSLKMVDNHLN